MTIRLRVCVFGLLLAALSAAGFAQKNNASGEGGLTVCFGQYALCSSAGCSDVAGHSGEVNCDCELPPEGLNVGKSSCQWRGQKLTSTFSLWDLTKTAKKPAKRSLICDGENAIAWAFCLDSPCKRTESGVTCTCALKGPSDYNTLGGDCDLAQCKVPLTPPGHEPPYQYWSGASVTDLLGGYGQLWPFYEKIPLLNFCQP